MAKNTGFSFNNKPGFKCFVYNETTRCTGMHRFLRNTLYPTFELPTPKKKKKARSKAKGVPKTWRQPGGSRGRLAGKRVDRELKKWTEDCVRGIIVSEAEEKKRSMSTNMLIAAFQREGWTPIEAQGIIGIPDARLATSFDLTLRNEAKELVLVEVKRGFDGIWKASNKQKLEKPVSSVPATCENLAIIQAAETARWYKLWRGETPVHVYVVRACDEGVDLIPTDEAAWLPAVLEHLDVIKAGRIK